MTEQAGHMNQPDLIDDMVATIQRRHGWSSKDVYRYETELRYQLKAAMEVLKKRGLLNELGLELIKSEEMK